MDPQRKLGLAIAAATVAIGAACAPAAAQPPSATPETTIWAKAWAKPSKAGTKARPRGLSIRATARVDSEDGYEPPIVTGLDILVGKGLTWRADRFPRCSVATLDRRGPDGCPKRSVVGRADVTARADDIVTHPDVVFLNGGWKRTFAYVTLYRPALVRKAIVVKRVKMDGRWGHKEILRVPRILQVVAGVPIQVTGAELYLGGKPYPRDYVVSTACPRGGWKYRVTSYYLFADDSTGSDTFAGAIPCTRGRS